MSHQQLIPTQIVIPQAIQILPTAQILALLQPNREKDYHEKENIVIKENVLNDETFEAMKETELLKNCSNRRNVYTDVDKMIRDILEESIGENDEK